MICVEITHLTTLLTHLQKSSTTQDQTKITSLLTSAQNIGGTICNALKGFLDTKEAIPYEVDGNGGAYYMDDANVPSLLSLPVLGFVSSEHTAYEKTRDYVLSSRNPFYYKGTAANGVGGPHVGTNMTWPMAIVVRAMTSTSEEEIATCLDMLLSNTAGTGLMHESFNVNNGNQYTRSWFAWANGLFGELVLQLIVTHPTLVLKDDEATIKLAQSLVKTPVAIEAQKSALY